MLTKYAIRTTQDLWPTLLTLGERLGVLKLTYSEFLETDGEMGAIIKTPIGEPSVQAIDGIWDYIGVIRRPTGATETIGDFTVPVMASIRTPEGADYIHVNLYSPVNLRERAMELAPSDPEIAAALTSLGSFFLVDAGGNVRQPVNPHRKIAGEI